MKEGQKHQAWLNISDGNRFNVSIYLFLQINPTHVCYSCDLFRISQSQLILSVLRLPVGANWLTLPFCLTGTPVTRVTATDADDPVYGNSAKLVYSILEGQPYFSIDPNSGKGPSELCFKISNLDLCEVLWLFAKPDRTKAAPKETAFLRVNLETPRR